MKLQLFVTSLATSLMFGLYVQNIHAGFFMFGLFGFILLTVSYIKGE